MEIKLDFCHYACFINSGTCSWTLSRQASQMLSNSSKVQLQKSLYDMLMQSTAIPNSLWMDYSHGI